MLLDIFYFCFHIAFFLFPLPKGKIVHRGLTERLVFTLTYLYAKEIGRFQVTLSWICLETSISFFSAKAN